MKKIVSLIAVLASVLVFSSLPAHAASELEIWCLAEGETWVPGTSTCEVNGTVSISSPLTVLEGESISIKDQLTNNVTINRVTITNYGTINNFGRNFNIGTIINNGTINNYAGGTISNYAVINNYDTITNYAGGTIGNHGTGIYGVAAIITNYAGAVINNYGTIYSNSGFDTNEEGIINNYGTISNYAGGAIGNHAVINNYDTITNYAGGTIDNHGTGIYGVGAIINHGDIINDGTITNRGIITNFCLGSYSGNPPTGNAIVYYSSCIYLPTSNRAEVV